MAGDSETHQILRDLRKIVDEMTGAITRLAQVVETDSNLRERVERANQEERDRRRRELDEALEGLRDRVDGVAGAMRDQSTGLPSAVSAIVEKRIAEAVKELPDAVLRAVEKKIYELRIARWEAKQAGVGGDDPAPLPPPPSYREQTGKIILSAQEQRAHAVDDASLTPGQQRWIALTIKRHWWVALLSAGSVAVGWLAKWYHAVASRVGH